MKHFPLLIPLLILLLDGCNPNENVPKVNTSGGATSAPSINNAVVLTPANWRFFVADVGNPSNPNNYRQTFASTGSATTSPMGGTGLTGVSSKSSSYTLGITASAITDTVSFCYWVYGLYPPTGLRVGQTLLLKAKVKLMDVRGPGVSLVIRGDKGTKIAVLFSSTQGKVPIQGTADFAEYSIALPYAQAVDWCVLYAVMLPKTTGTVQVTDISLQVN